MPYAVFADALTTVLRGLTPAALAVMTRGDAATLANICPAFSTGTHTPASREGGDVKSRLHWSFAQFLGQLAATMGRWDLAESYFRHALELNDRMQAAPWVAHTRFQYARMLLRRAAPADAARAAELLAQAGAAAADLGMQGLSARIAGAEGTS